MCVVSYVSVGGLRMDGEGMDGDTEGTVKGEGEGEGSGNCVWAERKGGLVYGLYGNVTGDLYLGDLIHHELDSSASI